MGVAWRTPANIAGSDIDWRAGDIAWNLSIHQTVSGGRAIIGWVRLTDSNAGRSNNVLGVDYLPMYVETS